MCVLPENHASQPGRFNVYAGGILQQGHRLIGLNGFYVNAPYTCAHCGRPIGDMAGGCARVGSKRVCHPNMPGRPDCYRLITMYHEVMGVRLNETVAGRQDHKQQEAFMSRALLQKSKGA
jgi:hypothetical protein